MTKIRLYDFANATTLESNKSLKQKDIEALLADLTEKLPEMVPSLS